MSIFEALRLAVTALRANLMRSILTMLGIFIGVAAVIATVAVGSGARAVVIAQIQSLGTNLVIVVSGASRVRGVRSAAGSQMTLTEDDARTLKLEIPAIQAASPNMRGTVQIVTGNQNWSAVAYGVDNDYLVAREWEIASGRGFSQGEIRGAGKVALLGQTVVENLFAGENPIGQTIRVRKVLLTVIGVLAKKGQNNWGRDQDDVILVPIATAKRKVIGWARANPRAIPVVIVKVRDGEDMAGTVEQIRQVLRQRHRLRTDQDDDFSIRNLTEIMQRRDASSKALALLLAAVAAVSLVVGGIGIMNIMLVSVTERTREIGLRMAVGARRRDILIQFLIEATTLALLGGIAGVVLGVGAAYVIAELAAWPTLIQVDAIVLAVGVSAAIGVFFGFYPARRAALLDPIEALRRE
jgi:putative ABC transport system permease protein